MSARLSAIPARPPRLNETNDLAPDLAGPAMAHCGAWHPLTTLLWCCPHCGAVVGQAEEGAAC